MDLQVYCDNELWSISSKDVELVKDEIDYKVGDEVVFIKYSDEEKWENRYGGFIGDKYIISSICPYDDFLRIKNEKGQSFYVSPDQIKIYDGGEKSESVDLLINMTEDLVNSEVDDLVNSPKHYATDPSGVECIQIKRKMSANAGDAS